jgi:hypothetical protein
LISHIWLLLRPKHAISQSCLGKEKASDAISFAETSFIEENELREPNHPSTNWNADNFFVNDFWIPQDVNIVGHELSSVHVNVDSSEDDA